MDAPKYRFFSLIPAVTNIKFIAHRWRFISFSIVAALISVAAMGWNYTKTGSMLNFGIDFAGGSQVRLALAADADVDIDEVRVALEELGYQSSSAVTVPDAENEILVRVKEVLSIDEKQVEVCEQAVQKVGEADLLALHHPEGGSKLFLKYDAEPDYPEVERRMNAAGCRGTVDRGFGARPDEFPVEVALIGIGAKIQEQLDDRFGAGTVREIVHSETVGAKVGSQLKQDAAKSMLYAIGFIFLYVMIRFDVRFAPGGIVALAHDAFMMVGAFALTGKEFNLTTVAAILTIIGYSINDTIVVFDRVRERVALFREEDIGETTNRALNETLSRTILTFATTFLVVVATWLLGSGPIKDFAFALVIGMIAGTYSSLYIAAPIFLWVNNRFYGGKGHLRWLAEQEAEGTGKLLDPKPEEAGPTAVSIEQVEAAAAEGEGGEEPEGGGPEPKVSRRRRRRPQ